MKLLVVNQFGQGHILEKSSIPPIGASVDMFYRPYPKVSSILMRPNKDTLKEVNASDFDIEAIVFLQ